MSHVGSHACLPVTSSREDLLNKGLPTQGLPKGVDPAGGWPAMPPPAPSSYPGLEPFLTIVDTQRKDYRYGPHAYQHPFDLTSKWYRKPWLQNLTGALCRQVHQLGRGYQRLEIGNCCETACSITSSDSHLQKLLGPENTRSKWGTPAASIFSIFSLSTGVAQTRIYGGTRTCQFRSMRLGFSQADRSLY